MMGPLLVHLLLQGVLLYDALAWEVRMPKEINGLRGSCLVIPCSFSYTSYPPKNPHRVVWYQWVSKGYPLVYDHLHPTDVIEMFRGKTNLYRKLVRDCSLLITRLESSHHGKKLYAWIDPENVGWRTYAFYDVTSTILVDASPRQPSISVYGGEKMGDTITVACSAFHTCPYSNPTITLNGIEGTDEINEVSIKDGLYKITLTRTGVVKAESTTIKCSVTHYGGIKVTATETKKSKCLHQKIMIEPELADVTEGIANNFICSVYHSCQNKNPTITWNYKNMQITKGSKTPSGLNRISYSNIAFLGAKEDHGKKLICTATFSGGDVSVFVILHLQQYQKPVQILNETYFQYVADVIPKITALPDSCVVIPCSFKMEEKYLTRLGVLWVTEKGGYMFHTNPSNILHNFKSHTRLLGNPDEQNCTVEMDNVQTHDNGPFCFRAERENERYSFNNSCVFIVMQASPDKPVMSSLPEDIEPRTRVDVECSVNHTCSSHPPQITWSVPITGETISHNPMGEGVWETVSAVTFIPTGYEEKDEIVCTAKFWGGKTQENTALLNIRRFQGLRLENLGSNVIAPLLVFILICVLAGVFIYIRRHRRSAWNRFSSRLSMSDRRAATANRGNRSDTRDTGDASQRPKRREQRRGIWSQNSRTNNISMVSGSKPFSKPHMPSPKSEPKSSGNEFEAVYSNMDDLNVYGNV